MSQSASLTLQRHARKHAPGRFRGMDAPHAPAAGPASQPRCAGAAALRPFGPGGGQRRVHFGCSPEAVHGPNPFGRRPIGGFLRKGSRWEASPSCFRPPPLVPGLFWFRARVILLTDGPTRPIPRPPVRGKVPTFPRPEPPFLFSSPAAFTRPFGTNGGGESGVLRCESSLVAIIMERRGATCRYTPTSDLEGEGTDT